MQFRAHRFNHAYAKNGRFEIKAAVGSEILISIAAHMHGIRARECRSKGYLEIWNK